MSNDEIFVLSTQYEYYVPLSEFCQVEKSVMNGTVMQDYPDLFDSVPKRKIEVYTMYAKQHPNYKRLLQYFDDIQKQPTIVIMGNRDYSLATGKRLEGINISYVAEYKDISNKNVCTNNKTVIVAKPQVFIHELDDESSDEDYL